MHSHAHHPYAYARDPIIIDGDCVVVVATTGADLVIRREINNVFVRSFPPLATPSDRHPPSIQETDGRD